MANVLWECTVDDNKRIVMDRWRLCPKTAFHQLLSEGLVTEKQIRRLALRPQTKIPAHVLDILLLNNGGKVIDHRHWLCPLTEDKIDVLIRHGVNLNQRTKDNQPLIAAHLLLGYPGVIVKNPIHLIDLLVKAGWDQDQPHYDGSTLLHLTKDKLTLYHLLELGSDPNAVNYLGQTPVMINRVFRYVIDVHPTKKINAALSDNKGNSALHRDALVLANEILSTEQSRSIKDLGKLLDLGSDVTQLNRCHRTSLDVFNARLLLETRPLTLPAKRKVSRIRDILTPQM